MNLSEFDFELPPELIAQKPREARDDSRLLCADPRTQDLAHKKFRSLPGFLRKGDCLVLNDSKVIPARLWAQQNGRTFEVLLLEETGSETPTWRALVRPKKKSLGLRLEFSEGVTAYVEEFDSESCQLSFRDLPESDFSSWLERNGKIPLPPYIDREADTTDRDRYQTVYAKQSGSVAAPTAGLHFTESLLSEIAEKGVSIEKVTLHVGQGTFAPIRCENILSHQMHEEHYEVSDKVLETLKKTRADGGRIIAVGTTSLRVLESIPAFGPRSRTSLFIRPGYVFRTVDGLITNFHLPKSSLFVLICAFMGQEFAHRSYQEAIQQQYRFFSYGDAMAILTESAGQS